MTQRPIKFRFVSNHKDTGKVSSYESTLNEIEDNDSWQGPSPWIRVAVCQFTGLTDKKGTDIYEGDILTVEDNEFESVVDGQGITYDCNAIGEVKYHEKYGAFYMDVQPHLGGDYVNHQILNTFETINGNVGLDGMEVIGNIYENPELIKEAA